MIRAWLLLLGLAGAFWCLATLPSFWQTAPFREVSARIVADARFKPGVLGAMLAQLQTKSQPPIVQPEFSQAEALVTLRTAEEALQQKSSEQADREAQAAEDKVKATLSTNPTDSFLWIMLYSVKTARNGFDPKYISYLDQSYAAGPNEGWVALRRNQIALATFPRLPEHVQNAVIAEFAAMVDSDFIAAAAVNLTGVGWTYKEHLLAGLAQVDLASKQAFRKHLSNDGIKVHVPGLEVDDRPW